VVSRLDGVPGSSSATPRAPTLKGLGEGHIVSPEHIVPCTFCHHKTNDAVLCDDFRVCFCYH
jgi:hypothetical protein